MRDVGGGHTVCTFYAATAPSIDRSGADPRPTPPRGHDELRVGAVLEPPLRADRSGWPSSPGRTGRIRRREEDTGSTSSARGLRCASTSAKLTLAARDLSRSFLDAAIAFIDRTKRTGSRPVALEVGRCHAALPGQNTGVPGGSQRVISQAPLSSAAPLDVASVPSIPTTALQSRIAFK